jgi:hypothetical protein
MADEGAKSPRWAPAPSDLSLHENEVHVWWGKVNAGSREVNEMLGVLSQEERGEMQESANPKRFAASRHMLRTLLGRYTDGEPARLRLSGSGDRLVLNGRDAPHFDLSVSGTRAVVAVSATHPLAVAMDQLPSEEEVASRLETLPPREARQMEFLSPDARGPAVVGYQIERLAAERLAAAADGTGDSSEPRVERLKVRGQYVAALAAPGWDWSPSFWRYLRPGEPPDSGDEA